MKHFTIIAIWLHDQKLYYVGKQTLKLRIVDDNCSLDSLHHYDQKACGYRR